MTGDPIIVHLVLHGQVADFEGRGWVVAHDLQPSHHARHAVLMRRRRRPGETWAMLLAELAAPAASAPADLTSDPCHLASEPAEPAS